MASGETFRFDEFTLEVRERRLLRGGDVVHVAPKAYDVLVLGAAAGPSGHEG
jgi:DNA-binding winged helix-turn-helix (wHTH) protein